jgi:predicted RNase H-like HicB family nuclease
MKTYIALFEYEQDRPGFSVVFPDLPGLITAGDTYEEAFRMACEGLASHIEFLREEGEAIPNPRTLEQIEETWEDWREWEDNYKFMALPVTLLPVTTRSRRVNIALNAGY